MTAFEIRFALMKQGVSMRSIARKLGVSANSVSLVINRRMVSGRIMEEVAKTIKMDRSVVFSEKRGIANSPGSVC